MKTFYFPLGFRFSWMKPTIYRSGYAIFNLDKTILFCRIIINFPYYYPAIEENPKSRILNFGPIQMEQEWYDCAMTSEGIITRPTVKII